MRPPPPSPRAPAPRIWGELALQMVVNLVWVAGLPVRCLVPGVYVAHRDEFMAYSEVAPWLMMAAVAAGWMRYPSSWLHLVTYNVDIAIMGLLMPMGAQVSLLPVTFVRSGRPHAACSSSSSTCTLKRCASCAPGCLMMPRSLVATWHACPP